MKETYLEGPTARLSGPLCHVGELHFLHPCAIATTWKGLCELRKDEPVLHAQPYQQLSLLGLLKSQMIENSLHRVQLI